MKWDFNQQDFLNLCYLVVFPQEHLTKNEFCIIQSHHKNWNGVGNIPRDFYTRYIRSARKRGITFNVSIEYLWELFLNQDGYCSMTGLPILVGSDIYDVTASIDRLDNLKGYEEGNLQWVHKDFNPKLRRDMSMPDVIDWCNRVVRCRTA